MSDLAPAWFGLDDILEWLELRLPGWRLVPDANPYQSPASGSVLCLHSASGVCLWVFRSAGAWRFRTIAKRYWRYGEPCVRHRSAEAALAFAARCARA